MANSGLVHESTNNNSQEWYTPPEIFTGLDVTFDLDPCSPDPPPEWIPVDNYYSIKDNGLAQEWKGRIWMNPPYGQETPKWMRKLADHGNGIALVFARTDTQWFHQQVMRADLICFIAGRIKFINEHYERRGTPGCGSMLVAYGEECASIVLDSDLGAMFPICL